MLELFAVKDEATFTALTPWDLSPATQPDGRPSADKARETIGIAMREGSHAFEWRHRRLDGREFPTSVLLTRLEFAGHSLVQATVRDSTSADLAVSALRDSEERLRLAVEATGMGTYRWDHLTGKADYSPDSWLSTIFRRMGPCPWGRNRYCLRCSTRIARFFRRPWRPATIPRATE